MNDILGSTAWITLIGMGLVFVAILLLWGLMELVVRLTSNTEKTTAAPEPAPSEATVEAAGTSDHSQKLRAAAAAVAYALAARKPSAGNLYAAAPTASGSAWQAVTRSYQLNLRGQMFNRKSRGNKS